MNYELEIEPQQEMITAHARQIGLTHLAEIDDPDAVEVEFAIVLQFKTHEELAKAMRDKKVAFDF